VTEHVRIEPTLAIFKATVSLPTGGKATGYGSETSGDFGDFIEKAETKAIGRALNALGYGAQFGDRAAEEGEAPAAPFGAGGPARPASPPPAARPRAAAPAALPAAPPIDIAAGRDRSSLDRRPARRARRRSRLLAAAGAGTRRGPRAAPRPRLGGRPTPWPEPGHRRHHLDCRNRWPR
jgi:hypothetical protein